MSDSVEVNNNEDENNNRENMAKLIERVEQLQQELAVSEKDRRDLAANLMAAIWQPVRLPDAFLQLFLSLPDHPFQSILSFLPATQLLQMRLVSHRFNQLIKGASSRLPKVATAETATFALTEMGPDQLIGRFVNADGHLVHHQLQSGVSLSEQLRFLRIRGCLLFTGRDTVREGLLRELSKPFLALQPSTVAFVDSLHLATSQSLRTFIQRVSPYMQRLHFQETIIPNGLLDVQLIESAQTLYGFMIQPSNYSKCAAREAEVRDSSNGLKPTVDFSDQMLLAVDISQGYMVLTGCPNISVRGVYNFVKKWRDQKQRTASLTVYLKSCEQLNVDCLLKELSQMEGIYVKSAEEDTNQDLNGQQRDNSSGILVTLKDNQYFRTMIISFSKEERVMEGTFLEVPCDSDDDLNLDEDEMQMVIDDNLDSDYDLFEEYGAYNDSTPELDYDQYNDYNDQYDYSY